MIELPGHAPFTESERKALAAMAAGWTAEQRSWLSGFLAGGAAGVVAPAGAPAGAVSGSQPLMVLYGTESGNCEILADVTAKAARTRGFKPKVRNMAEARLEELSEAGNLLVIVSTWGEGDPPETADKFYKGLMNGGPKLDGVRFSVCALGDTSYEQFCEIGKRIDTRLEELGGERLAPRVDCDVDFEEPHGAWLTSVLEGLSNGAPAGGGVAVISEAVPAVSYGKSQPFPAEVLEKVLLNGPGSAKETWHFELSLEGSGLTYEPGDSLAVVPENAADVVAAVLTAAGLTGEEEVETKSAGAKPLRDALRSDYDITALSRKVAKAWQERSGAKALGELLADENKDKFRGYVEGRQIVDLLTDFPVKDLAAPELLGMLRGLPPRLYSIASSPRAHEGEVHLTVAAVRYETHGRSRKGVASTCLADLVERGAMVPVYVTPNKRFRLPTNDAAPIIMVGPGTGVAPFRAFVEERSARGAVGKSWLIFGDQRYTYDFLYQLEWQDHLKSGALTKLDVAFSRDQPEKVYVQDRMREKGAEVWAWLEEGAHFYVCGDATRMAPDVHDTLLGIVGEHGGHSAEEAAAYLDQLKKDGRYQRDVY